jgi:hypothetical protein
MADVAFAELRDFDLIREILDHIPDTEFEPKQNSTWQEVDCASFDLTDMYGTPR